jgi:hypothetical protein
VLRRSPGSLEEREKGLAARLSQTMTYSTKQKGQVPASI